MQAPGWVLERCASDMAQSDLVAAMVDEMIDVNVWSLSRSVATLLFSVSLFLGQISLAFQCLSVGTKA